MNQTLQLDPKQPAAVLAFTLLELMHGHADKANSIVAPLVKEAPGNPFYQMAATEIFFQKQGHRLSNDAAIDRLRKIEALVEGWDEVRVFSQLGCMATLRGSGPTAFLFSFAPCERANRLRRDNRKI